MRERGRIYVVERSATSQWFASAEERSHSGACSNALATLERSSSPQTAEA